MLCRRDGTFLKRKAEISPANATHVILLCQKALYPFLFGKMEKKVSALYMRKSKGHIFTCLLSSWSLSLTPLGHKISARTPSWKPKSTLPVGKEEPLSSPWCKTKVLSTVPCASVSSADLQMLSVYILGVTSERNLPWQRSNRGNS